MSDTFLTTLLIVSAMLAWLLLALVIARVFGGVAAAPIIGRRIRCSTTPARGGCPPRIRRPPSLRSSERHPYRSIELSRAAGMTARARRAAATELASSADAARHLSRVRRRRRALAAARRRRRHGRVPRDLCLYGQGCPAGSPTSSSSSSRTSFARHRSGFFLAMMLPRRMWWVAAATASRCSPRSRSPSLRARTRPEPAKTGWRTRSAGSSAQLWRPARREAPPGLLSLPGSY